MEINRKEHIINTFSLNSTQEWYIKYIEKGLWGSEEDLIVQYFKPKSTVLDIGCGAGRTTMQLRKLGYNPTGIDITPSMIENAIRITQKKELDIKYKIEDVTKLMFGDSSFNNALFSFCGWGQIPGKNQRFKALKEIYRVLKPGGYFIFTTYIRKYRGYTNMWLRQWIKLFILNQKDEEFGDYFYIIESINKTEVDKQYMHMPSLKHVKQQILAAGFSLVFYAKSDAISNKNVPHINPMFFVCKK